VDGGETSLTIVAQLRDTHFKICFFDDVGGKILIVRGIFDSSMGQKSGSSHDGR
jgi:hypothetical protein